MRRFSLVLTASLAAYLVAGPLVRPAALADELRGGMGVTGDSRVATQSFETFSLRNVDPVTTMSLPEPRPISSLALRDTISVQYPGDAGRGVLASRAPDLRGAIDSAVLRHPRLRAGIYEWKAARADMWREILSFTPVITGNVEANQTYGTSDTSSRDSYASIALTFPLFTGGQRFFRVQSARSRAEARAYEAMSTRDQVVLQTIETWISAKTGEREAQIAAKGISRLRALRNSLSQREREGFASQTDVARIDADIALAIRQLESIRNNRDKAAIRHRNLTGLNLPKGASLSHLEKLVPGKKALLASAHRNNPDLHAASSLYWASLEQSRAARGRHLPRIDLTGEYRRYIERSPANTGDDGFSIGVKLTVPILDLSTVADSVAEDRRVKAALYREVDTLREVEDQIDTLWVDFTGTTELRATARQEVAALRKFAKGAAARFASGLGSLEDAANSEIRLLNGERNALQIEAQRATFAARLLAVSGRLGLVGG